MRKPAPSWSDAVALVFANELDPDTVTTVCSILENRRRQLAVLYLTTCGTDEWVSLTDLARWITAVTTDSSLNAATGDDYHNVKESLRHTHLPTLADAGAITYDADRTRLTASDTLPFLGRLLLHLLIISTTPDRDRS
jgi:hypothetical protein